MTTMNNKNFLIEKVEKHGVMAFGRLNPITVGHEQLINKVQEVANKVGGSSHIILSHSQDSQKNPLSPQQKLKHARRAFPGVNVSVSDKSAPNFLAQAAKLHKTGIDHLHMVGGQDRVDEYHNILHKYNGVKGPHGYFKFKSITVHSAGNRDPDAEGVQGMSASKMREHASTGNYAEFRKGVPSRMSDKHAREMYDDVRKGMQKPKPVATIKRKLKEQIDQFNEELTHKKFGPMLDGFVSFASDKLGLNSMPDIQFKRKDDQDSQASFGGYNPQTNCIVVVTKDRHPMDILRTVAHELVHQKQKQEDRIGKNIEQEGATGSDIENEANAEAGKLMRWFAKANPGYFNLSHMTEEYLFEGIYDPARHKAVFLAGGTGSGKDWVLKRTLDGHGLTEINSDQALEHLMNKRSLDPSMPQSERGIRDVARGDAKRLAREKQRLAMANRQGLIINGTADDPEKINVIKKQLDNLGYDSMMVFVNTTNKTSQERNIKSDTRMRQVPENIRYDKWKKAQKAKPTYREMFGDKFVHIDNNDDYNNVSPERKQQIDDEHLNLFKQVRNFTTTPVDNERAKAWEVAEKAKRGITFNKTVPITKGSRAQIQEDLRKWFSKTDPKGGWKRYNTKGEAIGPCAREPGEAKPKCMSNAKAASLTKQERASAVRAKRKHDPNPERQGKPINVSNYGKGKLSEAIKQMYLQEKNVPTNPDLWSRAKSLAKQKFDVYPSAYANGWAAKWYKSKGGGWKAVNEEKLDKDFENFFMGENKPSDREWGTNSLTRIYKKATPGQYDEDAMPPISGNKYGPAGPALSRGDGVRKKGSKQLVLPGDSIGPTAPTATMAAGGGVTGGGYSIPLNTISENVKVWMNNPKTQQRFYEKYGSLAEQKLIEVALKLDKLPQNKNKKAKQIKEFTSGDIALEKGASKGKSVPGTDTAGLYSGRGGIDGDRMEEAKEPEWKKAGYKGPGSYRLAQALKTIKADAEKDKDNDKEQMKESSPAWQRKEGKNPEGGLNKKGIESYRRENPGSKLSLAVTTPPSKLKKGSKRWKRRKSFCARMGGAPGPMKDEKGRPTRKALALRKWNCEE